MKSKFLPALGILWLLGANVFAGNFRVATYNVENYLDQPTETRRFVVRGETKVQPVSFAVRGVETKDLREGSDPPVPQVFEITGRETYSLADGGSTSIWVLEPFDMAAAQAYFPLAGQK